MRAPEGSKLLEEEDPTLEDEFEDWGPDRDGGPNRSRPRLESSEIVADVTTRSVGILDGRFRNSNPESIATRAASSLSSGCLFFPARPLKCALLFGNPRITGLHERRLVISTNTPANMASADPSWLVPAAMLDRIYPWKRRMRIYVKSMPKSR